MIGRPRKACLQCSSQKLRCVGKRPLCDRCKRIGRDCQWGGAESPEVPRPVQRPSLSSSASSSPLLLKRTAPSSVSHHNPPVSAEAPVASHNDADYTGIPLSVVLRLVDIYFSCLYSAPLLFHKQTLIEGLRAGTVKPHVVLSTCALASSFSSSNQSRNNLRDDGFSREWAERAGRLALLEAEEPSQDTIVSFTNLGLFWYSQGQWRRSLTYEGYASLNARLLLLRPVDTTAPEFSLAAELHRRQFWASFLLNQFISEPTFPKILRGNVHDILLPVSEDDYNKGLTPVHGATLTNSERPNSIFAELLRILSLWTDVYETIKDSDHADPKGLAAIQVLDAQLRKWHSELPRKFKLEPDGTSTCNQDIRPQVLLLHVTYHQCLCALHCSIVPLFSLSRVVGADHYVNSQRLSAQVAFDNAGAVSGLIKANLAQEPSEAYRWPGFVGFALYCSCAIQLPYLWCSDIEVREGARANIRDNLSAMAAIGQNWRYVAGLAVNVKALYQYHSTNPIQLHGPPVSLSASELAGRKEGERRALSSAIGGDNDSLWKHRSLMEQSKLANMDQEQTANAAYTTAQPLSPGNAHMGAPLSPPTPPNVHNRDIYSGRVSDRGAIPPASSFIPIQEQPYIPPILSSLFPNNSANYALDIENEHAEFLSTMIRSGGMESFDHEEAMAAWFNS